MSLQTGPFVLAIKVKIKPDLRDEWLKHWGVLAQHVKANEPQTLAYEVLEIEGEQDSFLVYERSVSPDLRVSCCQPFCV